jgi:hypothetical protein
VLRSFPATSAFEVLQLRRPDTPVTAWLPWHNVKVIVRYFLPAINAIILKSEYAQWLIRLQNRFGDSLGRFDYGISFCAR